MAGAGELSDFLDYGQTVRRIFKSASMNVTDNVQALLEKVSKLRVKELSEENRRSTLRCSRLYYGETLGREGPGRGLAKFVHPPIF